MKSEIRNQNVQSPDGTRLYFRVAGRWREAAPPAAGHDLGCETGWGGGTRVREHTHRSQTEQAERGEGQSYLWVVAPPLTFVPGPTPSGYSGYLVAQQKE